MQIHAPAKLNLCLYLGPRRDDGLHELCSLFEPLALADLITLPTLTTPGGGQSRKGVELDEVVCPEVEGENLAARALAALRERGWRRPPLRVEIEKRIPVAAGLGGGSADAAAILRLAAGEVAGLDEIALGLGADVPSQLRPALVLVRGAGESRAIAGAGVARRRSPARRRRARHRCGLCRGGSARSRPHNGGARRAGGGSARGGRRRRLTARLSRAARQ